MDLKMYKCCSMLFLLFIVSCASSLQATDNILIASAKTNEVSSPAKAKICTRNGTEEGKCFGCHGNKGWMEMKYVHGPLGMEQCSPCHEIRDNTVTQNFKETKDLCFFCHGQERLNQEHLATLSGRADKCLYCHNPHASEKEYFLR